MSNTPDILEARRALLEKYLSGTLPRQAKAPDIAKGHPQGSPASSSSTDSASPLVPLVPLQTGGSKLPFFYLHVHVEGGAFYCFTLAHHLGPDQPFYVLDPYRFVDVQTLPTIEAMGEAYVESLRAVQPVGPYFLGGFCGGGLLAFEVAQQLRAAGEAVNFLLLIEPQDGPAPHRMRVRRSIGSFVRRLGGLMQLNQDRQLDWYIRLERFYIYLRHVYDYLRIHYRRMENSLGKENAEHAALGRIGDRASITFPKFHSFGLMGKYTEGKYTKAGSEAWIGKFVWAISQYIPHQYSGKVTYLWSNHSLAYQQRRSPKAENGRVAEAEELEMHSIHGNHSTIINEHIHDLAEYLTVCLNEAQEAAIVNEHKRMSSTR